MADFINSAGNVCLRRGSGKQYSLQRAVAQLGSALEWGSRGRGFKSRRPEKFLSHGLTRMKHRLCVVTVPDSRLARIAQISHSQKITPTAIEFVDIAGLVKGASAGEGLGNQFLHHIREVDAIVQVVRCFENPDVHHVSATIDPIRDIEVINTELVLADLGSLQRRHDRLQKQLHAGDKTAKIENAIIEKLSAHLDAGQPAITAELTPEEKAIARGLFLLTSKPTIFACNVAESDLAAVAEVGDSD